MSSAAIVELLRDLNLEVFRGLSDGAVLDGAGRIVESWRGRPPARLVLAGAGTSGRLAWLLGMRHRHALGGRGIELVPWIAGGLEAFLVPREGVEDDVSAARGEFLALLEPENSFYLGISCGLSAPCVAAGLLACEALERRCAVFGTNSADLARTASLPGLEGGFRAVLQRLLDRVLAVALTPDVGPEPLTGSTRMKGGTATWVLLDAMLAACASEEHARPALERRVQEASTAQAGTGPGDLAALVDRAATTLRAGGAIVYLGSGAPGLAAVLDASECRPTFGAAPQAVRAFCRDGWRALLGEDPRATDLERRRPLSLEHFTREVRPSLAPRDLCITVGPELAVETAPARCLHLPTATLLDTKLALNTLSTGAFTRAGKVYRNRMIDLALSNTKLFDRASRIVQDLAGVSDQEALRSLVAAIYGQDPPSVQLLRLPVEAHLQHARPGIVPLALLHAKGVRIEEAKELLADEPVVREVLRRLG